MKTFRTNCMYSYNKIFLMMNIRRSKHVEDKKNLIKTLIWKGHFVG